MEQLLAAKLTGDAIEADTAAWVAKLEQVMAEKLARVGLIPSRASQAAAILGPFLTDHLNGRADLKPSTKIVRPAGIDDIVTLVLTTFAVKLAVTFLGPDKVSVCGLAAPVMSPEKFANVKPEAALAANRTCAESA